MSDHPPRLDALTPTAALRQFYEAVLVVWGDVENCEDCADKSEAGNDQPCALHGSELVYAAILQAQRVLGPCRCGHTSDEHFDEDTTRCRVCDCPAFKLPKEERAHA